jgi:hypothetical protein
LRFGDAVTTSSPRDGYRCFASSQLALPVAASKQCLGANDHPPGGLPLLNAPLPPPSPEPQDRAAGGFPKMNAPLQQNYAPLSTGTAAGLGSSDREAYSRSCANR